MSRNFQNTLGRFFLCSALALLSAISYANTTTNSQSNYPAITDTGIDMFTFAYNNSSSSQVTLLEDALKDFHKSFSRELYRSGLYKNLFEGCSGDSCEEGAIKESYDTALYEYIINNYATFADAGRARAFELSLGSVTVAGHLTNPTTISQTQIGQIDLIATELVSGIMLQIASQTIAFEGFGGIGMYMDGHVSGTQGGTQGTSSNALAKALGLVSPFTTTDAQVLGGNPNSIGGTPFDLMVDVLDIFDQFLCEPPVHDGYVNRSYNQGDQIIEDSGSSSLFGFAQLFGNSLGGSSSGDTSSGFNVSLVSNSSYQKGGSYSTHCEGNDTYETLFRDTLDWIVREFDKKNLQCIRPASRNFWEPTQHSDFKGDGFDRTRAGSSIDMSTRIPPKNEGNVYDQDGSEKQDKESQAEELLAHLNGLFGRSGLTYPGNNVAVINQGDPDLNMGNTGTPREIATQQREYGGELERSNLASSTTDARSQFQHNDAIEHMGYIFEEINLHVTSLYEREQDYERLLQYIDDKPQCGT